MLKLLGMGFAAERRLFGGGGEGGGGSAEPAKRSSTDVQNDINAALDASGGAWTSELNTLVSEREAAKATESAAPPPATKVENTAGLSVRVNRSAEKPYQVVNEQGYTVFSARSEDRAKGYVEENTFDEYLDAQGKSYATKKEADAANKVLFAASEREASREADAYFKSVVAGTAPKSTGTVIGAVSPQGTYAGDGFEWKQTSSGALTRVYTGANADRGLGTDTISAGQTSDIGLKNAIAQVSLDEGSSFAYSPISATDANLFSLILTGDSGRSASYADQIGAPAGPAAAAGPTGTDFTGSGGFNAAFRDAREALGPGQTFTYGGQQYSTATAAERPDLSGPTGGITTLVAGDPRVNMPPGALPAAPVDFSVTTSGRPYGETALRDIYVSGAEAALGPDAGVRYQDLRDTTRSYGADMGVTLPAGTGGLSSRDRPVIDLGEINVRAEADPFADQMQSWFDEAARSPLSSGTTLADLAVARVPSIAAQGVGSLVGSLREAFGPSPYGVNIDPETMEPEVFRRPTEPSAAERYLGELAATGREREAEIFSQMSPTLQQEVLAPIFTRQAGYDVGQVDPRLAAAAGLDPNELIFNPSALGTQAILSAPSTLLPLAASFLNPALGYSLGAAMTVGEGGREVSDAFDAAYRSGEVQQSPLYQDMLRQTGGDEAAALAAVKSQVMSTATPLLAGLGAGSTALARNVTNVGGLVTRALGIPAGRTGATLAGAGVEAGTEGLEEGFLEKAAIAQPAKGLTGLDIYPSFESMLGEGAVGALIGGGVGLGMGAVPSEAPFVQTVTPSGPAPFTPAAPGPAPFTPGPGPAATMTVEGTATDVTPGFRPTGPTVGQIAQTPPGLLSAYQQAAESLGEAGVRNIGGAPATMMDVTAATEIINDLVATYGGVPTGVLQNIKDATGLSINTIQDIVNNAPVVGTGRDELLIDEPTGVGGGGRIGVTTNPDGSVTLTNLTTGREADIARVGSEEDLATAIQVFDEATTVASPEAITVSPAGEAQVGATTPVTPIDQALATTQTGVTPTTTTQTGVTPRTTTTQTGVTPRTTTEALTGIGTTGTSGIGSLTTVGAGTQLNVAQPVDLTATPAETAEIIEFTPTEDVIEGTAVEIAGQIPGTVAATTTPATTETTATTTVPAETFVFAEEPPDEEDGVLVEIEDKGPVTDAGEEGVEVDIPPEVQAADEEEEAPFECPEGYTAVKMAGRWVCQKTETTMVGRPTVGTRPYLSKVGFAGPSPRPQQLTTRTRTVTAAE